MQELALRHETSEAQVRAKSAAETREAIPAAD
jgi:hypothetical protein